MREREKDRETEREREKETQICTSRIKLHYYSRGEQALNPVSPHFAKWTKRPPNHQLAPLQSSSASKLSGRLVAALILLPLSPLSLQPSLSPLGHLITHHNPAAAVGNSNRAATCGAKPLSVRRPAIISEKSRAGHSPVLHHLNCSVS